MKQLLPKAEERPVGLLNWYWAYTQIQPAEEPDLYCSGIYIQASTFLIFFLYVLQYFRILLAIDQSNWFPLSHLLPLYIIKTESTFSFP